jgi:dihydroorotate dehydrogenase (NAD+) catalytic subunit
MSIDISTKITKSLRIRNPTMLASGILGISYDVLKRVYYSGAGAVVTKSISIEPREGYKSPTIVKVHGGYINAIGLANPGIDAFMHELSKNNNNGDKSKNNNNNSSSKKAIPIILNLVGSSVEEFKHMVKKTDEMNILGYELNLSCPHVEKVGLEVGDDPELVYNIIKGVRVLTDKAIIAKLGLGNSDMLEIARVARDAGADALTVMNTVRAMAIDVNTCMPILSNKVGGLSGKAIKPIALRCVYELYKSKIGIPIIGCGGVSSWIDAIEYILAGASAVQVGSALCSSRWIRIFKDINNGITRYLDSKGFKSIEELIGVAHRYD